MIRLLAATCLGLAISLCMYSQAYAAPVVGFDPGMIIDDSTFTNSSSMSVSQIQAFLNSKVASCDTGGTQPASDFGRADISHRDYAALRGWSAPPYVCLKDYSENGISAAQIIYNIAQTYSINPQVLIVTLQKENGLVTDTWPLASSYRTATGYACGDKSACESKYFGFTNQVTWAAKLYHNVVTQSPTWYAPYTVGSNYIAWHPDFWNANTQAWEDRCGGTNVTIQNWATAALYNYTPYQPNQAALNAGWGTGDGCSAYGNRNFYLYFNEWFGGYLISTVDNGNLYIRGAAGTYYQITTLAQLNGLGIDINRLRVYNTTSAYLASLTSAGPLTAAVQFNSLGDVYSIDSNKLHYFSAAAYQAYGRPTISNLAAGLDGGIIPRGTDMTAVLAENNVGNLFAAKDGERRYISAASYGADGYANIPITWMSGYFVNAMPTGVPILPAGSIMQTSDTKVSSILSADRTTKRLISAGAMASISHKPYVDTSSTLDRIPTNTDTPISVLARDSVGNLYIVDGAKKVLLSPSLLASLNKQASDFVAVDDLYLNKFTTTTPGGSAILFWLDGGARVYRSDAGEMAAITSQKDFQQLGYDFRNVVNLSSSTASQLFTNRDRVILPAGSLYKLPTEGRVYALDDSGVAHLVPTGDMFSNFAFSWSAVRDVNQTTFDHYNKGGVPISSFVITPDGNRWMVTNGRHYGLPTQLSLSYDPTQSAYTPVSYVSLGSSIRSRDATRFVRINNDGRVYYIDNGVKYPLASVAAFSSRGGTSWDMVISISQTTANQLPTGQVLY